MLQPFLALFAAEHQNMLQSKQIKKQLLLLNIDCTVRIRLERQLRIPLLGQMVLVEHETYMYYNKKNRTIIKGLWGKRKQTF